MRTTVLKALISCILPMIALYQTSLADSDPHRFDDLIKSNWYGVYMQDAKIGYGEMAFERIDRPVDGWHTRAEMTMIINVAGRTDTMTSRDNRIFTFPEGELYYSKLTIASATGEIVVEGKKEADEFIVLSNIGGQTGKRVFDYPVDYLDSLTCLQQYISTGKAAIGDSFTITSFEATPPVTGTIHQRMTIESMEKYVFNGVPTDVYTVGWHIREMNVSGHTVIDRAGNELEFTVGGGILMKLETESQAKRLDADFDFLSDNLIKPTKRIDDPRKIGSLKLEITGIDIDDILRTDNQAVVIDTEGTLTVKINKGRQPLKMVDLPIDPGGFEPYLSPGPYIQSKDEEIINLAGDIIEGEKNSWEAAKRINRWVYENIEKRFTPDISNALQTLHSKRGDCGEHSALTVALMRAAGIPARPVAGLVYWPPGDGFGYHAWIEVYIGEWVMMDPSWDEDLINPSHIALTRGDLIEQVSLLHRVLGKMGIEVIETE